MASTSRNTRNFKKRAHLAIPKLVELQRLDDVQDMPARLTFVLILLFMTNATKSETASDEYYALYELFRNYMTIGDAIDEDERTVRKLCNTALDKATNERMKSMLLLIGAYARYDWNWDTFTDKKKALINRLEVARKETVDQSARDLLVLGMVLFRYTWIKEDEDNQEACAKLIKILSKQTTSDSDSLITHLLLIAQLYIKWDSEKYDMDVYDFDELELRICNMATEASGTPKASLLMLFLLYVEWEPYHLDWDEEQTEEFWEVVQRLIKDPYSEEACAAAIARYVVEDEDEEESDDDLSSVFSQASVSSDSSIPSSPTEEPTASSPSPQTSKPVTKRTRKMSTENTEGLSDAPQTSCIRKRTRVG
ncbi:hypothetical protein BKA70DRAFT_1574877 [Coprinopsis sp. MPI-PUGE-AT-0042]|nr:hypothetical protein BKA70DRAFT_1574877 [Coprinopsis sp. MPI-PUGE-AT-0042]